MYLAEGGPEQVVALQYLVGNALDRFEPGTRPATLRQRDRAIEREDGRRLQRQGDLRLQGQSRVTAREQQPQSVVRDGFVAHVCHGRVGAIIQLAEASDGPCRHG